MQAKRGAIYRLLCAGHAKSQVAKRLQLSAPLVQYHAKKLEAEGVLRRTAGRRSGEIVTYGPGPAAGAFEEALRGDENADRLVRSMPPATACIHRGHISLRVQQAPECPEAVVGYHESYKASKVPNHIFRWTDDEGRGWKFRFVQGKSSQSVVVYPPAVRTADPADVETAEQWWPGYAAKGAHQWAQQAGFSLARATPKRAAPLEVGIPTGVLAREGDPARHQAWVDDTPEKGTLESREPLVAAAAMRLPYTEKVVEAHGSRLQAIEDDMRGIADRVARLVDLEEEKVRVFEGLARVTSHQGQRLDSIAGALTGHGAPVVDEGEAAYG